MFLLRDKLIMQGEKRETLIKTCNETMCCAKLRVFVSRISPPLSNLSVCQVVAYGRLKTEENFKLLALKVVTFTYGGGHLQEVPNIVI